MIGCDVVLWVEWLCTLGIVIVNFKELYTSFIKEGHKHIVKGITFGSPEIITSHCMEKLLKKGHLGIIAQFDAIQVDSREIHLGHPTTGDSP